MVQGNFMVSKLNKNWIYFLCIAAICLSCTSEKKIERQIKSYDQVRNFKSCIMGLDFQKGFENDTVSLKFNDFNVFTNVIAKTYDILDATDCSVRFYKLKNHQTGVSVSTSGAKNDSLASIKIVKIDVNHVTLKINVNGISSELTIDIAKGKYIGISKTSNNQLEFIQDYRQFYYE